MSDISLSLSGSVLRYPLLSDFFRIDLDLRWCSSWGLALLSIESTERDDLLPLFLPGNNLIKFRNLKEMLGSKRPGIGCDIKLYTGIICKYNIYYHIITFIIILLLQYK